MPVRIVGIYRSGRTEPYDADASGLRAGFHVRKQRCTAFVAIVHSHRDAPCATLVGGMAEHDIAAVTIEKVNRSVVGYFDNGEDVVNAGEVFTDLHDFILSRLPEEWIDAADRNLAR